MRKFEEEVRKNGGGCFEVFKNGKTTYEIQGLTSSPLIIFGDWVSPEDHQQVAKALVNTPDKLDCAEERVDQLKSRLEKQKPEIPQFVADYLKRSKFRHKGVRFSLAGALKCTDFIDDKTRKWLEDWHNQEIFAQAWRNGYTVETPKVLVSPCPVCGYEDVESNFCGICGHKNEYIEVAKEKLFYLKNKLTGLNLVEEKTFSLTGKHVGERFREFEMQYIPTDDQEARLYKNTFTQQEIGSMETGSYEQMPVEVEE